MRDDPTRRATVGGPLSADARGDRRLGRAVYGIECDRCGGDPPTWHFVDQIASHVGTVCVVDTRKTKLKAGYAAKTDRLDARRSADALRRESVVSIYVPPPAIRELRELSRHRLMLTQLRTRVLQRCARCSCAKASAIRRPVACEASPGKPGSMASACHRMRRRR